MRASVEDYQAVRRNERRHIGEKRGIVRII
jgi:hypothetical protein